jgi:hypothetical protein
MSWESMRSWTCAPHGVCLDDGPKGRLDLYEKDDTCLRFGNQCKVIFQAIESRIKGCQHRSVKLQEENVSGQSLAGCLLFSCGMGYVPNIGKTYNWVAL